jgi:hypothetical protein
MFQHRAKVVVPGDREGALGRGLLLYGEAKGVGRCPPEAGALDVVDRLVAGKL